MYSIIKYGRFGWFFFSSPLEHPSDGPLTSYPVGLLDVVSPFSATGNSSRPLTTESLIFAFTDGARLSLSMEIHDASRVAHQKNGRAQNERPSANDRFADFVIAGRFLVLAAAAKFPVDCEIRIPRAYPINGRVVETVDELWEQP